MAVFAAKFNNENVLRLLFLIFTFVKFLNFRLVWGQLGSKKITHPNREPFSGSQWTIGSGYSYWMELTKRNNQEAGYAPGMNENKECKLIKKHSHIEHRINKQIISLPKLKLHWAFLITFCVAFFCLFSKHFTFSTSLQNH